MMIRKIALGLLVIGVISCNSSQKKPSARNVETYPNINIVGAMKNVMWKGELGSSIDLDTISNKKGLYGLGPEVYLTGELLINNGKSYVSKVASDSTMTVEKRFDVSAPFFVHSNVIEWNEIELPNNIKSIEDLEKFIDEKTLDFKRPFTFKLIGQVSNAIIHIQNLPAGTKVSSPKEAHQGQINYGLRNEDAEIIGYFSTEHKGVFTHHDSFLHMHLITADETKMGHLDELEIGKMKLYLPKK
ncbi:acetolactate decarboxylase [Mangrovimonas aestuarii]|uniref:acetolactate decarboxylase n=1 Tax=Mangrovimonas aestuarii TaxID=3018443 RepID=UPI0023792164|nr:acetolactate decarboxylase [Mangrovimonas aestuarii]